MEEVENVLRALRCPFTGRDLLSLDYVGTLQVSPERISVGLSDRCPVVELPGWKRRIETALEVFAGTVRVFRESGCPQGTGCGSDAPQAKPTRRVDLAPDTGYGEAGPMPLQGPAPRRPRPLDTAWSGPVPVYQWEVDPGDPEADLAEAYVELEGWDFNMWWQTHDQGLVYASIQALQEDWSDADGRARRHAVGRQAAVNLVYDLQRRAVVAIYGTARDFRPFVEAFWTGYGRQAERSPDAPHQ